MNLKLFAVYLGGRAAKCNTELHDVVFVVGPTIESTYEQIMDQWFGTPLRLHLDSWLELTIVDGHKITLSDQPSADSKKLFFINLGAYAADLFGELHATKFIVAETREQAKILAKRALAQSLPAPAHTDDLHEVDDCLEIDRVGKHYIHLHPTDEPEKLCPTNGYHLIPKALVQDYIRRKSLQINLDLISTDC